MTEYIADIEALDLGAYVRTGDTVVWGQACAEPVGLTGRLVAQRAELGPLRCFLGIPATGTVRPEHADHLSFVSYCGSGGNRALHRAGLLDIVPCHYADLAWLLSTGPQAADVLLLLLPPPDPDGTYRMGLAEEYLARAIDTARVVIAEVSDRVPRTTSGRRLTEADLDVVVRSTVEPVELSWGEPSDVERAIAAQVAAVVPDGATMQLGIGTLPDAVLGALNGHRDLGVHSGLICDGMVDLIERGVITNACKTTDPGQTVGGVVMGSRRLFDLVDDNPDVLLRDTGYTHAPEILAAQHRLVAINSAVEVDLTGEVNAESAGGRYVGAVGGAPDFLRGAARSPGGLPIVALPSERIVARLSGPVSTGRCDAGLIVTEHGVADLRGGTVRERRDRMLAITHPERREQLAKDLAKEDVL